MATDSFAVMASEMRAKADACPQMFAELATLFRAWAGRVDALASSMQNEIDNWRKQALAEDGRANALERRVTELEASRAN